MPTANAWWGGRRGKQGQGILSVRDEYGTGVLNDPHPRIEVSGTASMIIIFTTREKKERMKVLRGHLHGESFASFNTNSRALSRADAPIL